MKQHKTKGIKMEKVLYHNKAKNVSI